MGSISHLACVEHDFGFDVVSLLIHHVYPGVEFSTEILNTKSNIKANFGTMYYLGYFSLVKMMGYIVLKFYSVKSIFHLL